MPHIDARAADGSQTKLDRVAADALATSMRGYLLIEDDPGYDEARRLWNGMIDRRPALIARCIGVADVVACVNFARDHGVLLSIRSGGHNIAGLALADGALTIDTSLMRGVHVDAPARRAHAQAGCVLGDVDRETQLHGLAAVLGFVSNTGVAGLTVGGGFGYLTRRFGWTSDTVKSFEVVTADGRVVRTDETNEPDLFWGLRGGGGNFGVVTNIEYELFPVGPEIMGGAVAWRAADAPAVLEMYRRLMADAPPEFTCVAALRMAPPAPWLPKELHGTPIVALFVCDTGPMDEARNRATALKSFGTPVGDVLQPRPYLQQQSLLDATQPNGRRYYWKSEFLPGVEPAFLETCLASLARMPSAHSAIMLFPLDGALNALSEDHSAVGSRDTKGVVNISAAWDDPAHDDANIAWARETWDQIRPFSTGRTYVNFLNADDGAARTHDAYRGNYGRLADVKRAYDPGNVFRTNKNITPSGADPADRGEG
ncbi:FAD-binding oxidoreductase [soil metagenome]